MAFAERGATGTTSEANQEMERLFKRSKESKEIQASSKITRGAKLEEEYLSNLNES
jgi:hypothetical protein